MIREADFYAHGKPQPQPRPRMTKAGHAYNPPSADAWKAAVRSAWASITAAPFPRAIRLRLRFILPRPKGHWTTKGKLVKDAPAEPIGKPDVDNLAKAVMDALENAGAFPNDCAVLSLTVSKRYADREESAGCRIIISEIDP